MTTKLTWYGHATLGLETDGHKLLIDPFFSGNPATSASADETEADFILVSHGHGDHVGDTVSIAARTGALVISNFEIANWFDTQGVEKTHPQHLGGGFQHPFGYLKLTLALHGSALPDGSYGGNPAGFLLTTNDGKKIYMAQDTGLFGDMSLIGDEGIDLAVLPIGDNFTMGPEDALRAVKLLRPKVVIPIHYNTWDLIAQNPVSWADEVQSETQAKVVILEAGEHFQL
ncbi:MAG: metal-dependent hydrolase [Anaerolineae bacterium]|mgnify:FL=1|jgi:L-ascorbate metabolism protein UlaG (beta-lactamase superfamily)|nr:metal-dependent hydrolase [Anaerolineae bacterium]MBT7069856.1 metal-dependent hydrolase [Anaerolineae bacterium]MBT7324695.1 metal-dependent hydrolase [Anaerolineae bacterium]